MHSVINCYSDINSIGYVYVCLHDKLHNIQCSIPGYGRGIFSNDPRSMRIVNVCMQSTLHVAK